MRAEAARLLEVAATLGHVLACPAPPLGTCPTFADIVRRRAEGGAPPEPPEAAGVAGVAPEGDAGA